MKKYKFEKFDAEQEDFLLFFNQNTRLFKSININENNKQILYEYLDEYSDAFRVFDEHSYVNKFNFLKINSDKFIEFMKMFISAHYYKDGQFQQKQESKYTMFSNYDYGQEQRHKEKQLKFGVMKTVMFQFAKLIENQFLSGESDFGISVLKYIVEEYSDSFISYSNREHYGSKTLNLKDSLKQLMNTMQKMESFSYSQKGVIEKDDKRYFNNFKLFRKSFGDIRMKLISQMNWLDSIIFSLSNNKINFSFGNINLNESIIGSFRTKMQK